ncbi:hypothetical protein QYF36_019133 [Acer negundo]|nr:hypothetical protein QYF36_019133 [Acer negundo]
MAERGGDHGDRGSFKCGFGRSGPRGDRGGPRGHRLAGSREEEEKWLIGQALKEEVMKIMPVQKQTRAGQRTRFKAFVVVGDGNDHVGWESSAPRRWLRSYVGPSYWLSCQ